ncbi:MAG: ankyrin repeat domain-containing protein [Alphaproteobacteria bacterium]|nr:ankyrin repeat domain-containing protein [Alphaproteobacteria bacterium]
MKYVINLCSIFVLLCGEVEAMAQGGHTNIQIDLDESNGKYEIGQSNLFRELNSAIIDRNNDIVKFFAKKACRNRFRGWNEDQKAILLFYAVMNGLEEVVEDCADSRFNINVRGCFGKTPLIFAIERGYDRVAEYLLESGADLNIVDVSGFSPLMVASWRGCESLVRTLIGKGANVNASSHMGYSSLLLATERGYDRVAEYLLESGADPNVMDIYTGFTPLMFASWGGCESLVRTLIGKGANVNAFSYTSYSPLSLAMGNNQWEVVEILRNAGAILINQNCGITPSMALYYNQKSVENDREKTKWNAMIRKLKKLDKQKNETEVNEPPARSSVWSFFRSFFRRFQTPGKQG